MRNVAFDQLVSTNGGNGKVAKRDVYFGHSMRLSDQAKTNWWFPQQWWKQAMRNVAFDQLVSTIGGNGKPQRAAHERLRGTPLVETGTVISR